MICREGTFTGANQLNLYYQSWNPKQKVKGVVVIVHGLGGHSSKYNNIVHHLVDRDFAIYAFDQRGHGRSPGQRGYINSWAELRADLATFLQLVKSETKDCPRFLLGHSLGAAVVLDYGLRAENSLAKLPRSYDEEASRGLQDGAFKGANLRRVTAPPFEESSKAQLDMARSPRRPSRSKDSPLPGSLVKLQGIIAMAPPLGAVGVPPWRLFIGRVLSQIYPRFSLDLGLDLSVSSRDPQVIETYLKDPLRHTRGTARLSTEFTKTIAWINAHAQDWQIPLLILYGGEDRVTLPHSNHLFFEDITFADKEIKEYPESYHELQSDLNYQEVLGDIEDWLERHL